MMICSSGRKDVTRQSRPRLADRNRTKIPSSWPTPDTAKASTRAGNSLLVGTPYCVHSADSSSSATGRAGSGISTIHCPVARLLGEGPRPTGRPGQWCKARGTRTRPGLAILLISSCPHLAGLATNRLASSTGAATNCTIPPNSHDLGPPTSRLMFQPWHNWRLCKLPTTAITPGSASLSASSRGLSNPVTLAASPVEPLTSSSIPLGAPSAPVPP